MQKSTNRKRKKILLGLLATCVTAEFKLRLIKNKICEKFKKKIKLQLRYVDDAMCNNNRIR